MRERGRVQRFTGEVRILARALSQQVHFRIVQSLLERRRVRERMTEKQTETDLSEETGERREDRG